MLGGYTGKMLWVDLTQENISIRDLVDETAMQYIGGGGLAAKIVWDETTADTEPLSPQNPLVFVTGPLTSTDAPGSSRYIVGALSPLTGIWGQAHSGGSWADELKRSGFDGIVFTGKANRPVYLWLNNGDARIVDASHLWGKDVYEVDELLKKETDSKASVAAIGQAGERLVRIACVMNDGRAGRAAARGGLGSVMGSKNLKAIVVRGTRAPEVYDAKGLKSSVNHHYYSKTSAYRPETRMDEVRHMFSLLWDLGRAPFKNWSEGDWEGARDKFIKELAQGEFYHCRRCRYSCTESRMLNGTRHTVWEGIGPLGSQCLIDNMEAIRRGYDLCNRFGLDSISTGGVIAFAMEAWEKGLITRGDTGGIDLTWGNGEGMVEMVSKIGLKEGFGELLGEGTKKAASHLGGLAPEYAMHVKGLEMPAHDPRADNGLALSYATGTIGASHMWAVLTFSGKAPFPEIGIKAEAGGRRTIEGKGELVAKTQDFTALINSLGVCWLYVGQWMPQREMVQPSHYLEWLNLATGWKMELKEFMKCGERITNLQRMLGARQGIKRKDDTLPARFLTHKLHQGGTKGNLPPIEVMLNEYYAVRGWDQDGIPTPEKLKELNLGG